MAKSRRIVLGLNSGTSADGVDAVACEIIGRGPDMQVRVLGHAQTPYPPLLRERILRAMAPAETRTEEICRLETEIGEAFAQAADLVVSRFRLKRVDLIGSHGQTVCHLPPRGRAGGRIAGRLHRRPVGSTLQLGDPAVIAARLGVPVVARFRQADVAVGGQGAPLVPWTDFVLFRDSVRGRIVHNIGGIANLTWIPAGCTLDQVQAFDTGPGNMIIDALVRRFTRGRESFDRNGRHAVRGTPHPRLLKAMLRHPFFSRKPPKSCGREEFGGAYVAELLSRWAGIALSENDWIATATALTATSMAQAYSTLLRFGGHAAASVASRRGTRPPRSPRGRRLPPRLADEVVLCGGGAANAALIAALAGQLQRELGETAAPRLTTTAEYGIPIQAKEGVSFAMLAAACVDGCPANLPQVTGASRRVVLGQVCRLEGRS